MWETAISCLISAIKKNKKKTDRTDSIHVAKIDEAKIREINDY